MPIPGILTPSCVLGPRPRPVRTTRTYALSVPRQRLPAPEIGAGPHQGETPACFGVQQVRQLARWLRGFGVRVPRADPQHPRRPPHSEHHRPLGVQYGVCDQLANHLRKCAPGTLNRCRPTGVYRTAPSSDYRAAGMLPSRQSFTRLRMLGTIGSASTSAGWNQRTSVDSSDTASCPATGRARKQMENSCRTSPSS